MLATSCSAGAYVASICGSFLARDLFTTIRLHQYVHRAVKSACISIANMRIVYITCILLASTICSIAGDNAGATGGGNSSVSHLAKDVTAAVPSTNSAVVDPATVNATTHVTSNASTNIPANPTNTNATGHTVTEVPNVPPTDPATTASTTKPATVTVPTTVGSTTTTTTTTTTPPPPTSEKPTTKSPVTSTTSAASTASTGSVTTTGPISTKVAPPSSSPYKERHFDGLSFLGGIILAVCLMAISVFSWKFYRTFNERNYRTL